jgi:exosortase
MAYDREQGLQDADGRIVTPPTDRGARARLLVAAAALLMTLPALKSLTDVWWTDSYAGHAPFVPLFSALLLWSDRRELRKLVGPPAPAGGAVLFGGLGLLVLGHLSEAVLVQGLAVVAIIAGAVLWILGSRWLRAASFPITFLVAMVPLPRAAVDLVTQRLQLLAASFATTVLQVFSVPVYRHGVFLELPEIQLEVAELCNGLRFLLALLILTAAFAQVTQRSAPRKIILVAVAVPIAILANATRVATLALGAHYIGPEVVHGAVHHTIGKVVWLLTLVPLAGVALVLRREPSRSRAVGADQRMAGGLGATTPAEQTTAPAASDRTHRGSVSSDTESLTSPDHTTRRRPSLGSSL